MLTQFTEVKTHRAASFVSQSIDEDSKKQLYKDAQAVSWSCNARALPSNPGHSPLCPAPCLNSTLYYSHLSLWSNSISPSFSPCHSCASLYLIKESFVNYFNSLKTELTEVKCWRLNKFEKEEMKKK